MKPYDWYGNTAQHMWLTFFAIERDHHAPLSQSDQYIYDICKSAFSQFTERDKTILQDCFSIRRYIDRYFVEDYSLKNNTSVNAVWTVIRRAERTVIEYLGIIEKKTEGSNKNERERE